MDDDSWANGTSLTSAQEDVRYRNRGLVPGEAKESDGMAVHCSKCDNWRELV